jgi:RNA polymerase sigma-70 factor (ECF subfamily)
MEDEKIIALFFQRDTDAINQLEAKHGKSIYRTAHNILGSAQDAEECANDTYLAAWNTIPPQSPAPLVSYVCRIARNLAIGRLHANTAKKRNTYYDAALDELEESIPSLETVETEYDAKELSKSISDFLGTLSYDERFMFMRRYWYADSVTAIGQMMGLSAHKVSVKLFRVRERLERQLSKEGMLA